MLRSLGALFCAGRPVRWAELQPPGTRRRCLELPAYPWQRTRHWLAAAPGGAPGPGEHPLLGRKTVLAAPAGDLLWELEGGRAAALDASRCLKLALAAAEESWGDGVHDVEDLEVELAPHDARPASLQLALSREDERSARFRVFERRAGGTWVLRARARLVVR